MLSFPPPGACREGQRALEHRYRFGQAVVFGLPVIALQIWGTSLGGVESERWVALFQALLGGWVVYVAATGMVVEGVILLMMRGRMTADAVVGAGVFAGYLWSAAALVSVPATGGLWHHATMFHLCVIVIAVWCGARWRALRRRSVAG